MQRDVSGEHVVHVRQQDVRAVLKQVPGERQSRCHDLLPRYDAAPKRSGEVSYLKWSVTVF